MSGRDRHSGSGPADRRRNDGGRGKSRSEESRGGRADKGRKPRDRPRPNHEETSAATTAKTHRPIDPPIDEDVTGKELDQQVRGELRALPSAVATAVAQHLVMAGQLLDEDPEQAYGHAMAARRRAGRVGVVREAAGVAAYATGRYSEALAELRAARRMTGSAEYLPMMADSERALGRSRRALDLSHDPAVVGLDTPERVEMLIVAAGARRDLGEHEAAAISLQVPELRSRSHEPWVSRLRYAYADALLAAGREQEARQWFVRAADVDDEGLTDAAERAAALKK